MTIRAEDVREAARALGRFSWDDLCGRLPVRTYAERKAVKSSIRDFRRRGEVKQICPAWFEYAGAGAPRRSRIDVIWHLVRSHRAFSTDDIERLSGAARATVLEYLRCLVRAGLVRRAGSGTWQLVKDTGPETPINYDKCRKLKAVRARKRGA